MQELPEDRLAEELRAIEQSLGPVLAPASEDEPEAEPEAETASDPDEEDAIRARLRQIRQDTAHIPVAEEKPEGLIGKIKGLFGR